MSSNIGRDGFIWWIGIVEGTDDPLQLGRCRVRCFSFHPKRINTTKIEEQPVPPEHLPWATVLIPGNLHNFYGRPNAGDWVMGFFIDGAEAQEPIILGILPAIPSVVNEYFSTHPRFAKTFTKIKNDDNVNRSQIINTLHSLVDSETKQLVTLPDEGKYLTNDEVESVRTLMTKSEARSDQVLGFYHVNGSRIELGDSANLNKKQITKSLFQLSNGSNLELRKETLNDAADTTDYVKLAHNNGINLLLKTDVTAGNVVDTAKLTGIAGENLLMYQDKDSNKVSLTDVSGSNLTLYRDKTSSKVSLISSGGASLIQYKDTSSSYTTITESQATIQITGSGSGTTINITHPQGGSITISPDGNVTVSGKTVVSINAQQSIALNSLGIALNSTSTVNQNALTTNSLTAQSINLAGVGDVAAKIAQMESDIALAMTLP